MNTSNTIRTTILATAMVTACSWAAAQDITLYESHTLPDALVFEPKNTTGMSTKIDMIVKGPEDFYLRKSFEAGEAIEFNLAAVAKEGLVDGTYRYELRVMGIDGITADRDNGKPAVTEQLQGGFGAFSIRDGKIVAPEVEPPHEKFAARVTTVEQGTQAKGSQTIQDQVINDDLIVTGSMCVGFDCVNGESFGFDTIRMKENNTRIKFDDTSTSSSFPNNDWELIANDSANGGLNKFSIANTTVGRTPFTIEGPAPSNALYVDDGGRVGFNTSTPVVELHSVDGNSPTLRLEQDGSSGFAAQTWDMAGNEANFFVRDVTNGSRLPFRIQPSAPTNSLYISSTGDIGLGTASPSVPGVHIKSTGRAAVFIEAGADEQSDISFGDSNLARFIIRTRATTHNFEIARRAENGGSLDRPFLIPFATGIAQFENGVNLVSDDEPPTPNSGAVLFVDNANGDLMVKFSNGTVKTLLTN